MYNQLIFMNLIGMLQNIFFYHKLGRKGLMWKWGDMKKATDSFTSNLPFLSLAQVTNWSHVVCTSSFRVSSKGRHTTSHICSCTVEQFLFSLNQLSDVETGNSRRSKSVQNGEIRCTFISTENNCRPHTTECWLKWSHTSLPGNRSPLTTNLSSAWISPL